MRTRCISALSQFLIFALSYSHILTLHSATLHGDYSHLEDGLPFDGSNWLETDYCPTASDRFECEVTVDAAQPNASAAVFGTVREQEPERTFAFYVRQGGDDSSVVTYGDTVRGGFFPRGKKVTLSVGPDGATWTWDGGFERLSLTPGFARDGVTPLMIGDANAARSVGGSVPAGTGAAMTLHRFRIWRGGLELVHDYVPRLNETNCMYCLYDIVREKFLPLLPYAGLPQSGIASIAVVRTNDTVEIGVKTDPGKTYALLRSPTVMPRSDYAQIGVEAVAISNRLVLVDRDKTRPKKQAFYIVVAK